MAVNGIEIKVGQTWATRQAGPVRIIYKSDHPNYKWQTSKTTVSDKGEQFISSTGSQDLVELIREAPPEAQLPTTVVTEKIFGARHPWFCANEEHYDESTKLKGRLWSDALHDEALPEVPFPTIDAHSAANDSLLQKLVPGYIPVSGDDHEALTFYPLPEPGLATNPKDAIGSTKLPLHLWPAEATALGCLGMLEGKEKYGRNNYIAGEGVVASIYIDAAKRHIDAWFSGEEVSPDTQNDHLGNALACLAIIVKTRAHGKLIDDRDFAPNPGYRKLVEELTPNVKRLQELFTDKSPRHFTIADNK